MGSSTYDPPPAAEEPKVEAPPSEQKPEVVDAPNNATKENPNG